MRLAAPQAEPLARGWHLVTALAAGLSLLLEFVVTLADGQQPPGARLVRLVGYFTIQATVLVLITTAVLVRDAHHDGVLWRASRLYGLVALLPAALVYVVAIRPVTDVSGWSAAADTGLHVVTPLLAAAGWALFGPRDRIAARDLPAALVFLLGWVAWTLLHGAVARFYPYPFINVMERGYWSVFGNCAAVGLVLGGVAVGAWALDRRLDAARR